MEEKVLLQQQFENMNMKVSQEELEEIQHLYRSFTGMSYDARHELGSFDPIVIFQVKGDEN